MNDPFLVRGLQRLGNLTRDRQRLFQRDSALFDPLGQRRPLDQLHHQIVGTDIVKVADVGVIQRRDGVNLTLEPVAETLRGDLDGDLAPHARIAGAVHLTHAARAEGRQDLVGAETRAGGKSHRWLLATHSTPGPQEFRR